MVNYKGSVINGAVFDESKEKPSKIPVARTVKGWQEALPMMPTGSKWKLFIPADLGYGPSQRGPVIEPNSVLIFEIELVRGESHPVYSQGVAAFIAGVMQDDVDSDDSGQDTADSYLVLHKHEVEEWFHRLGVKEEVLAGI